MKLTNGRRAVLPLLLAFFAGSAQALTCKVTPEYTIVAEGQTVELSAQCDDSLLSADWKMGGQSVTGVITLTQPIPQSAWACDVHAPTAATCPPPVKFTTPVALDANGSTYSFTLEAVANDGVVNHAMATSSPAMVYVKPTNVLAAAAGQTGTEPIDAQCGTADGAAVQVMPSGAAQCQIGDPALAITSANSYSWTCVSPNNGADKSCYATRGYTVTAQMSGAGGVSVSPTSQGVAAGGNAVVTATPSPNYSPIFSSTCGGSASGNTFTTGAVNAPCTVTASFSNNVSGVCGSQNGQNTTAALTSGSANLCSVGSVTSFAAGTGAYTWTCQGIGSGASPSCQSTKAYVVSATAGANGSISPASQTVAHGSTTTFTTTPSGNYVASTTGCGGSQSGNTYTTGAITAACTVTASFAPPAATPTTDPGNGLWLPPNTSNVFVADQSGSTSAYKTSFVPGCLNGGYPASGNSSVGCAGMASYTGTAAGAATTTTVSFGSGKQVSVRYRAAATAGSAVKYFKVKGADGGNVIPSTVKVWLSNTPTTTFEAASTACRAVASTATTAPLVATGPNFCPISPNGLYYLNIRVDTACSNCRYIIDENFADFQ